MGDDSGRIYGNYICPFPPQSSGQVIPENGLKVARRSFPHGMILFRGCVKYLEETWIVP